VLREAAFKNLLIILQNMTLILPMNNPSGMRVLLQIAEEVDDFVILSKE
jgi:hypothetical protein